MYPRVGFSQPVTLRLPDVPGELGGLHRADLVNLSGGGFLCEGRLPSAAVDTRVVLTLRVRVWRIPRRLHLPARLVRVEDNPRRWGLEFQIGDERDSTRLERYVGTLLRVQAELRAARGDFSPLAEAFRMVQVRLTPPTPSQARIVLVTSAMPREGKSFVASGLAAVLSGEENRVLLVDADLYRPSIHKNFDVKPSSAVARLLMEGGSANLADLVQPAGRGIFVLSAGGEGVPSELFSRGSVASMFDVLRKSGFGFVIVDSPPVLVAAGATLLAAFADDVLLAVRSGFSRERQVRQTRAALERAGVTLRGVILNDHPYSGKSYYSAPHLPRATRSVLPGLLLPEKPLEDEKTKDELARLKPALER
jgi:Mrp family chromosome partitioning ATPase